MKIISNIILYVLILGLSAATIYFYLKSSDSKGTVKMAEITPTATATPTPTPTTSPTPTTAPKLSNYLTSNKPSNPAEVYTLKEGEVLSTVSGKFNVSWSKLSEINNITNPDSIKAGETLVIPDVDEKTKKLAIVFKVDPAKANEIQQKATVPTNPYLDPVATAKKDSVPLWGIKDSFIFTKDSANDYEGTGMVIATFESTRFEIYLTQPVKKGKDGIWAIDKIIKAS